MNNKLIYIFKSKLNINVSGLDIERFIKRLYKNKIDILNIEHVKENEVNLLIYKKDYEKIMKLKTIYDISIINYSGVIRLKNNIIDNKYVLSFLIVGLVITYILSNMIFKIEIKSNNNELNKELYLFLEKEGVKKYRFKKSYNALLKIKNNILTEYKKEIEWIEIECVGTKYIVKYEPRVIKEYDESAPIRNIVAKKDGVIYSMNISSGNILKGINSYVKKGDIIVSGEINLNDEIKNYIASSGTVLGEVWYTTTVKYPYKRKVEVLTGKKKKVIGLSLFNKNIYLSKKYKHMSINKTNILRNNLLPLSLNIYTLEEKKTIYNSYNEKELIKEAIKYSKSKLKNYKKINDYKIIKKTKYKDYIELDIFYSLIEDIGEYQKIIQE